MQPAKAKHSRTETTLHLKQTCMASLHLGLHVVKDNLLNLSVILTIFSCYLSHNVLSLLQSAQAVRVVMGAGTIFFEVHQSYGQASSWVQWWVGLITLGFR